MPEPAAPAVGGVLAGQFKQDTAPGEKVDKAQYDARWQQIWGGGLQPGQLFDIGNSSPQLLDLISSGTVAVKGKRCLVPGCGRGYDVLTFAQAGAATAVGLEISETAKAEAEAHRDKTLVPEAAARAHILLADFFAWEPEGGAFDVGYDYTFFCALHPDMRADWAASWARLLKPGGELVTMVYPIEPEGSPFKEGPPWPVTPALYEQYLPAAGFECVHLQPIKQGLSVPQRQGREWLGRWRRTGEAKM